MAFMTELASFVIRKSAGLVTVPATLGLAMALASQPATGTERVEALSDRPLAGSASPYLRSAAQDAVRWRPWGAAALAEAMSRDVPILVSAGFAACHWCHVMARESFSSAAVAALLESRFVPVKLDRAQHPEADALFIAATRAEHGVAGWPNQAFLRPDGTPFRTSGYVSRAGFLSLLAEVDRSWREDRAKVDAAARRLARQLAPATPADRPRSPSAEDAAEAAEVLVASHNALEGGFSETRQFPEPGHLLFLLDHWRRTGDRQALEVAGRTLDAIAAGALHDHVGGGFHRYTEDPGWRRPHFEKMLATQALLSRAFLEGWQATGNAAWRRASERGLDYVLRVMRLPSGAFASAEGAESVGADGRIAEGAFYAWGASDLEQALGPEDAAAVSRTFGLGRATAMGEPGPLPWLPPDRAWEAAALDPQLDRLRMVREKRPRPQRDETVLAGWNGLMIGALSEAALALDRPDYTYAARRAAETLLVELVTTDGLMRIRSGETAVPARLEDHASLGLGMLELAEATGELRWREAAMDLARAAAHRYALPSGRLTMSAGSGMPGLRVALGDGETPAGESAALALFARLSRATGDAEMAARARDLASALGPAIRAAPARWTFGLRAARLLDGGRSGMRREIAEGAVVLGLSVVGDTPELRLRMLPGWHVVAAEPGVDWAVPALLEGAGAGWPAGVALDVAGFGEAGPAVYGGSLAIPIRPDPGAETVAVTLQACGEGRCLPPERAEFRLPVTLPPGRLWE